MAGVAAAPDAHAVVVTFNTPISIPATSTGVYINLLTGVTGTSSAPTNWDFNPYRAGSGTQLGFYWNQDSSNVVLGGVVVGTFPGPALSLAPGAVISGANTFSASITGSTTGSPVLTTGTNTLGFRFWNETLNAGAGGVSYGYMNITTPAGSGFPATINSWSIENVGGAITVVPEPGTALLLSMGALALGAVNMRRLRRQRKPATH